MKMRNRIMIIIGSLLLVVIMVFIFLDGTFLPRKYSSIWSNEYIGHLENDQSRLIANAIQAASSHNTQPWLVKSINSETIELYADMEKALHVVDSDYQQMLMSQGTFIERYREAASQYGYGVDITYNEPNLSENMPLIATIKIHKNGELVIVDVVSSSTYSSGKSDKNTELEKALDQCISDYPGFSYTILESSSEIDKLKGMLLEGTIVESKDEAAAKELLDVFRWTEWQKNKYRYGLSLNTLPSIIKPFIQPIMKSSSNNWDAFGDSGIKQFKDRLALQTKYILIKCENPTTEVYIKSGEIYQKLLQAQSQFDLKPAMQLLEKYDAMIDLNLKFQQDYGADGEVLWIIGVQEKASSSAPSNPRHLVDDIIVQ